MASIYLNKAVSLHLGTLETPIVTRYDLGAFVYGAYKTKTFRGQQIKLTKDFPEIRNLHSVIRQLVDRGILLSDRDFPNGRVFRILGKKGIPAEDIACSIDPFAYISHLSAMDYHGLTDRLPRSLYLSSPVDKVWKELAFKRMQKDCNGHLDQYLTSGFPTLRRMAVQKIAQRPVVRRGVSDFHGAYRTVQGRAFRVTTIGRTFLEMLREPALCGGMSHVLDVFKNHCRTYLDLIIAEIDKNGSPIDKVRAGYIFEERCLLEHQIIQQWLKYVQRGGSRKLDAKSDYSSTFSENWSLSINVIGA